MKKTLQLVLVIGLLTFAPKVFAATLSVSPSSQSAVVGQNLTLNINLDTVSTSIEGVDILYLNYNSSLMDVVDANTTTPGIQISPGSLMPNTVANSVDTVAGKITFSQVSAGGATFTGSGILATVTFKAKAVGTVNVNFSYTSGSTKDANVASNGSDVLTAVTNGIYNFTPGSTASPSGPAPASPSGAGGGGGGGGGSLPGSSSPTTPLTGSQPSPSGGQSGYPGSGSTSAGSSSSSSAPPAGASASNLSTGSLSGKIIKYPNSPTVYIIQDGARRPISRFDIYQKNFQNRPIATVPLSETYPDGSPLNYGPGTLIKARGASAVYLVLDDGSRYGFGGSDEFKRFGYRFDLIKEIEAGELTGYPLSELTSLKYHGSTNFIKYASSPTVYMIENKIRRPMTSPDVFFSYAGSWNEVLTVPDDITYPNGQTLSFPDGMLVKGSDATVYYVEGAKKRGIRSAQAFFRLGFQFSQVRQISDSDLNLNEKGTELE